MAPRQNLFFDELVSALRHEAELLGCPTSLHVGNFPPPRPDLVYVLVPPHEYFSLLDGRIGPSEEARKRTIFVCAEQPGTPFFNGNLQVAPRAGAVFDINRSSVEAFEAARIPAQHLQLGWTPEWDHLDERERDIDILFLGCISERRARALGSYAEIFSKRRVELVLSDNSLPNWTPSASFKADQSKWDLLRRAKILLNVHQGSDPYFEWLRIVQAMSNGAVVVSEHSVGFQPLVAGEHLLLGERDNLALLTEMLLDDDRRRWQMRTAAYEFLRHEVRLSHGVSRLVQAARDVASSAPVPNRHDPFFTQPQPDPAKLALFGSSAQPKSPARGDHNAALIRRALKDVRLELLDVKRALAREILRGHAAPPARLEVVAHSYTYGTDAPRVSVLTALYNHSGHIVDALESAAASVGCQFELIVVDDGSTDTSSTVVESWMAEHQDVSILLLRHPINQGLAQARNDALGWARGEFCFVLDADNEVFPHCLERLAGPLQEQPAVAFSYGTLEAFAGAETLGLMNLLPWEPSRLRVGNYIDAMAMVRTRLLRDELGGYATDRRLHGWEDFELWCRIASAGYEAVRVPEILGRYRSARHSMLSVTNLSMTDAFSLIIEANPELMAGIEPPE